MSVVPSRTTVVPGAHSNAAVRVSSTAACAEGSSAAGPARLSAASATRAMPLGTQRVARRAATLRQSVTCHEA